jgi:hypothetical protein
VDVSPRPDDSAERRKRIDLSRSLASGRKIEKPVKAPNKFLEQARKFLPDEAKEAKDEIRSNKREAPFKFFNAYESLKQVNDELYHIKLGYEKFLKFKAVLNGLQIKFLYRYKEHIENIIKKIEKISSDPRFNEAMTGDRVREMGEALSRMEQAEEKLGLSYRSKKNKNAMKQYIQRANDFQSFIETINLEILKNDLQSSLAEIKAELANLPRNKETEKDSVNTSENTNNDRLSEGYNEARKKLDEFRTLYSNANTLWNRYKRELQQVFPEKYKEFSYQMVTIHIKVVEQKARLENREDLVKASQDLEIENEQLTEISDLCLKFEKVSPLLARFNQICRYLMSEASSQNTEQILKNLDESSGDSLLVSKIREELGTQDFQEFQKYLQRIDVPIRTMEIISKDPKELEDVTQWLVKKLGECEKAKDRLITELKRRGFSENTVSELTALTLKGLHSAHNTAYERIQAYMDSQEPREEEMRKVIPPQKLEDIRKCLRDASYLKELDEKELPQKSEDLITHHAQLSTLLKHFQVLEAALFNQHALSIVHESILYSDASEYQENITRGLKVFQVDTLSTNKLEKISNGLNNDLKQMNEFIQKKIINLEKAINSYGENSLNAYVHKTRKYLHYIEEAKSQSYRYDKDLFPKDLIIELKKNIQIYNEKKITLSIPDQLSTTDLWKLHNDLDTVRKDLSQALKTYEEPFLQEARLILREIDYTLKRCSGYVKLEEEGILPVKQDQEGRKETTFHHLVSGYRSALEDACIAYHLFPTTITTVKELLEGFEIRFEQVYPTGQRDQESSSPISPFQTHFEKMKLVNDTLMKKLIESQSTLQQMQITESEITRAQETIEKARTYQSANPDNTPKEFTGCLKKMEESVQAARKYCEKDLVSIVSDPQRLNDITELCQALKIETYRQKLEMALAMANNSEIDRVSTDNYKDIKENNLIAAQNNLKELKDIYIKIMKYWNNYQAKIKQDFREEYDNLLNQLKTSYEKVKDQTWLKKCEDLVKASQDMEEEKKQLTGMWKRLREKYKDVQVQSKLEDLRTTYEKILLCFAKDASHTYDQILENLDDPSQTSLLGKAIRKEFGPEQFKVFCQYLRTLSHYVRKDSSTDKYILQATSDRRFIRHHYLALNDTLNQFRRTEGLVNRVKDELGDEPTEEQLNQYLSDQSQKYTYTQIELYQHLIDDNKPVKPCHWQTDIPDGYLRSRKEEDDYLTNCELEKKVKILTYAEELGHIYYNCHSLTFTDGKAGWLLDNQVESILKANGFKKVWTGNVVTDQDHLPPDASVQAGDVIVYRAREGTDIQHTGYVSKVKDGKISITSKWGEYGIYEHNISNILLIYGPYYEIYHTNRPTDNPLKARLLKRADRPSVLAWVRKPVTPDV